MKIHKISLSTPDVPEKLRNMFFSPKTLFWAGVGLQELLRRPCIAIVGSRKVTPYGVAVTTQLTETLARAGLVIVSGLALGVDSLAHRGALAVGGTTVAVLPASLDQIYPAAHRQLAAQIVQQGGALVSEYAPGAPVYRSNFIARNRLVAGLADALLVTEATYNSGTLHTVRFALEQGKPVLAVPGNITSPASAGTNNLIKSGATPITNPEDVLHALGLKTVLKAPKAPQSNDPHEQLLLDLLFAGTTDAHDLHQKSGLDAARFNQTLTMLEIRGLVRPLGGNRWGL